MHDEIDFYPEFTHQYFGDGESIFGYRNLKVMIYYSAARLNTYLSMSYTDKITEEKSGGVKVGNTLVANVLSNSFVKVVNIIIA